MSAPSGSRSIPPMKLALLGLGKMGVGIGTNLLKAGHSLTVWNRTKGKAAELLHKGAKEADTPAEAVKEVEVVISILFDDAALTEVTERDAGLLSALPRGAIHINLATVSVDIAKRLTELHAQKGQVYIGGAVLGKPDVAAAGKLIIIAAGDDQHLDSLDASIFSAIGRRTFRVGKEPWIANLVKLAANYQISAMIQGYAEAQAVTRKAGVDPNQYVDLITELFGGSAMYKAYGGLIASRHYQPPGGTLALGLKDNGLLAAAALDLRVPMPTSSVIRQQMIAAVALGLDAEENDWTALGEATLRNAGINK